MGQPGGEVHVWDAATGEVLSAFRMVGGVTCLAFSSSGLLAAGSGIINAPGQFKGWDVAANRERFSGMSRGIVWSLAFTPDGTRLASGGGFLANIPGEIKLWDTVTGQETLTLAGHASHVTALAFSADGTRLASAGFEGTVKLWEATPLPAGREK